MKAVEEDLISMKVDELKVELEARDEVKTGGQQGVAAAAASCGAIVLEHLDYRPRVDG